MEIWLLCLMVFGCRILDVSLATLRTIQVVKGNTLLACMLGFVETLLWFLVVRQALNSSDTGIFVALSYAGGFASGTFVGSMIAKLFSQTKLQMQVITSKKNPELIARIRHEGYAVTCINVNGSEFSEEKDMLFVEISAKKLKQLKNLITSIDDHAFIITHESKHVFNGYFGK